MSQHRLLDLGQADVHQDGAARIPQPKRKTNTMATKKPKADPRAAVEAAIAQLEKRRGTMPPGRYRAEKSRLKADLAAAVAGKPRGLSMRGMRGFRLSIDNGKSRIEVRHMRDVQCPTVEVALLYSKDDTQPVWNQIAKPGRFIKDGSWFTLDERIFADIIRNFEASSNKEVPFDFEHASEMPGSAGAIAMVGAPAQGWIKAIEMRGDGTLWGLVQWGDLARQYIHGGQYKYISPAVRFGCKDTRTGNDIGARLTSAALTNTPFLDGMQRAAAKDQPMGETENLVEAVSGGAHAGAVARADAAAVALKAGAMCYSTNEYMPQLRACLGLSTIATGKMCKDTVGMLREALTASGGDVNAMTSGVRLAEFLTPMRNLVNAPFGATYDDVLDIFDEMIERAIEEHEEQYHGASPVDASLTATDNPNPQTGEEEDMTTPTATVTATDKSSELTIQLKDETNKRLEAETIVMKLTAEKKEVDALLAEQVKRNDALTAEVQTLKDAAQKAADAALEVEVDNVVLAYKDTKGIGDSDKPELLKFLKASPALFHKQYPAITPAQAHLMRDVATGTRAPGAGGNPAQLPESYAVPDMKTLTDKLIKDGKSLEDATSEAYASIMGRVATLQ